MADNRGAPPSRGFRGDGKKKEQAHHQPPAPPYQYPNRGELRHRAPRQTVKEAPPAVAFRSQLPNPWGSGGGPRLLPVSHRYSKIPNGPPPPTPVASFVRLLLGQSRHRVSHDPRLPRPQRPQAHRSLSPCCVRSILMGFGMIDWCGPSCATKER